MNRDPAHYLSALRSTTTPKRLLWLDCAAQSAKETGLWVERWHCGALGTTHYTSRKGERVDDMDAYDDAGSLWYYADGFCGKNRRVVLFAYDLAYQLRVSQALVHLPRMGWRLDKIVLERTAAWALLRNGTRTLMMCDLKSWMPIELSRIAEDLPGESLPSRVHEAGPDFRASVAVRRATIVREATLQMLNWIEGENLGPFRPTGSGQSYSAYRRRFMAHKLLVHDDIERLSTERRAMWTGRCEAWRHGNLNAGPYVEYDMRAAYCHIARDCEIPTVARRTLSTPTARRLDVALRDYAVLAEVELTTQTPIVPTHLGGRTVWPVGTFRTTLWDPELELVRRHADKWKVTRAYLYERGPALQGFGAYVLGGMGSQTQVYGLIPRHVLKHWSRCLVGRMGLRYRSWEKFGWQHPPDLRLVTFVDTDAGTSTDMLIAGNDRLVLSDMQESVESLPQIPGWVMSECRRRLWEAMRLTHLENVVYVDTDSIIVRPMAMTPDMMQTAGFTDADWSVKGTYTSMTIHGPRNLVANTSRRVAGLPLTAKQVAPLEFTGQVMRSIKESMRAGQLDCVASVPRKFVLDAPDLRRQHLPGGMTAPFEVQLPTEGMD